MNGVDLSALRDIHMPPPPTWWPPAPGWWLVALAIGITILMIIVWVRRHRRRRLQRAALFELKQLQTQQIQGRELAAALSLLLRRYVNQHPQLKALATLEGETWLKALDDHSNKQTFCSDIGQTLISAPYQPMPDLDGAALAGIIRDFIRKNP